MTPNKAEMPNEKCKQGISECFKSSRALWSFQDPYLEKLPQELSSEGSSAPMTGMLSWYIPLVIWDMVVVSPGIQAVVLPGNEELFNHSTHSVMAN